MVVDEILKTETAYLRDLDIIISIKQQMAEEGSLKDFLTTEDISAIFSNVESLRAVSLFTS